MVDGKIREGLAPEEWKAAAAAPGAFLWVDISGPGRKALKGLKDAFGFDSFSMAAIREATMLPKLDTFKDYAFLVIHALGYDEASGAITRRELDMFIGKGYLVTVQEDRIPELDKVYKEAQRSTEIMARGPGILAYVILDRLVDLAYEMVDVFDDDIEAMEAAIAAGELQGVVDDQLKVRRALLLMRKSIGPQRDVLNRMARRDTEFITAEAALYYRDLYDRISRVYDMVDTNRELVAAAAEAYRSMVSLRISQINLRLGTVMERLTLVATIFLPLTFIVGLYGMNFEFMPELTWWWFYPALLVAMLVLAVFLVYYFYRRGWLHELKTAEAESVVQNHTGTLPAVEKAPVAVPEPPDGADNGQ
jgi:magnesium transporter